MNRMIVLLVGKPGCGKNVQGTILAQKLKSARIITSVLLQAEIDAKTTLGLQVEKIMAAGDLVGNEIVFALIKKAVEKLPNDQNIIFDGFPRTKKQAEFLMNLFVDEFIIVVELRISDETAMQRSQGRTICLACNMSYHNEYKPAMIPGQCDQCCQPLIIRNDDGDSEKLKKRISDYKNLTIPSLNLLKINKFLYRKVDGEGNESQVANRIKQVFGIVS